MFICLYLQYKAPLPKKKLNDDSNTRLVKSADSIRESSLMRTHSSPQIPIHGLRTSKSRVDTHFNDPNIKPDSPQKVNKRWVIIFCNYFLVIVNVYLIYFSNLFFV